MRKYFRVAMMCLAFTGGVMTTAAISGCNEGPLEEAAESVEEGVEEVADEIDDATTGN
jgi:hypothetical protein